MFDRKIAATDGKRSSCSGGTRRRDCPGWFRPHAFLQSHDPIETAAMSSVRATGRIRSGNLPVVLPLRAAPSPLPLGSCQILLKRQACLGMHEIDDRARKQISVQQGFFLLVESALPGLGRKHIHSLVIRIAKTKCENGPRNVGRITRILRPDDPREDFCFLADGSWTHGFILVRS